MSIDENDVKDALVRLRNDAAETAGRMPEIDVSGILEDASVTPLPETAGAGPQRRMRPAVWIPRSAAAVAVLALATAMLFFLRPQRLPTGPVPDHLTALVDSLYSDTDYVYDQLSQFLSPASDDNYLDDVWDTVISGISDS